MFPVVDSRFIPDQTASGGVHRDIKSQVLIVGLNLILSVSANPFPAPSGTRTVVQLNSPVGL